MCTFSLMFRKPWDNVQNYHEKLHFSVSVKSTTKIVYDRGTEYYCENTINCT